MAGDLAVPLHLAVEFLVLVVALGAAVDALRSRRYGAGVWATGQGLGFISLAVAQVVHGSLISPAETGAVVLGLRIAGFGLLAVSARPAEHVIPTVPAVSSAIVAAPAIFFPGASAELAIAPGVLAAIVAGRGIRAHRVDQDPATFSFAAAFVSFAVAEFATVSATSGSTLELVAHGARTFAALFLARWLWTAIVGSVRLRFVASFVLLLTVAVVVVSAALNAVIGQTLEQEELKRLAATGLARTQRLRDIGEAGIAPADAYARNAAVAELLDDGDPRWQTEGRARREELADGIAGSLLEFSPSNTDLLLLVNRRARVIGAAQILGRNAVELPRVEAVQLAGSDVVGEALRGDPATSAIVTSAIDPQAEVSDQLVVLTATPSSRDGEVIGAVVMGFRIDERFLNEVAQDAGAEISLVLGDALAATTFVEAGTLAEQIPTLAGDVETFDEGTSVRSLRVDGDDFPTVFVPVRSTDRQALGFIGLSQRIGAIETAERDMTRTLFLIAFAAVLIAAALAWLSGARVTRPIRSLTEAARELQSGNLEARTRVSARDEVGTLGEAFNDMAEELERQTADLASAATTEATLRARIESIMQSMGDGLIATDPDGTIVTFNRAAEQLIKVRADRAVGRSIGEVLSGSTDAGRRLASAALTGRATQGVLNAGRRRIPVALTSAPLRDARGEEVGRVVVIRDVSALHEAERMKSEFLSNVSHELRTPITPIKGYAEILKRKSFPRDKTEQFLDGVLESTERLERIVEILVDFASLEAGRLKPREETIPVKGLLDGVTDRWRRRGTPHRFVRRKGSSDRAAVRGDERLLERALNELLDNAVKFSPDGGTIEISSEPETGARGRGLVRISVADRGIGIEPERMPDLFQDFRQLDGSETRTYGGLGLGLAYVKRIMTAHGGDVEVTSTPGKGSVFSLVVPAADTSTKKATTRRAAKAPARPRKRAKAKTTTRKRR